MAINILGLFQKKTETNLNTFPAKVGIQRLRQDVATWRAALKEAEEEWWPFRVKMQELFADTELNGHVTACMEKRKNLTLLRELTFVNGETRNEDFEKVFTEKWFLDMLSYCLDAIFYGYTLVALGDIVNNKFPNISSVRRWFISPDRLNVASYKNVIYGAQFMEEPYKDWHIWVDTPSNNGQSPCGYGLLYKVAMYEIICRNLMGFNADAAEVFGMPIRVGKTNKTEESERALFLQALVGMASNPAVVMDMQDEIELLENNTGSTGYQIFADLEKRCEAKISKIILGHADALDSTPGKLGSDANGAAVQALQEIASKDGKLLESLINDQILPKLKALGLQIPEGVAVFSNDNEKEEFRAKEDASNKVTADIAVAMSQAGMAMDVKYFTERTGIPAKEIPAPPAPKFDKNVQNKLNELYK